MNINPENKTFSNIEKWEDIPPINEMDHLIAVYAEKQELLQKLQDDLEKAGYKESH